MIGFSMNQPYRSCRAEKRKRLERADPGPNPNPGNQNPGLNPKPNERVAVAPVAPVAQILVALK